MNKYYYIIKSTGQIETTDSIDDLILLLYAETADFISDSQVSKLKLDPDYIQYLRKEISTNQNRVPMYDVKFNRIYLIHGENVYLRIFYDNYRFVDKQFYHDLLELTEPSATESANIKFLSYYDFDILQQTYLKIFYDSFVLNEYITSCKRPSFSSAMSHIKPYYSLNELYYLALDWDLVPPSDIKKLNQQQLCKKISSFDIPSQTLLFHQIYIADHKAIGLVKNYSLFGSYFINRYLRKYGCCLKKSKSKSVSDPGSPPIKNSVLENQIKLMIELIRKAPEFTNSHTVYRFIESDDYLTHLKVSDTYTDPSFMSTTRNPFSYQENYTFGYILLKIKIPAGMPGIGLCIESYSNFPSEEEIILPPTSVLELVRITDQSETKTEMLVDAKLSLNKIKRKYEFVLRTNSFVNDAPVKINMLSSESEPKIHTVDFEQLFSDPNINYTSMADRLKYFTAQYVNSNSQFESTIRNTPIKFILESYNSSSIYKEFFYYETNVGILMYSFHPIYGNINIMLELGPEIHVNYYFRFSVSDTNLNLAQADWIQWLSFMSAVLGSRKVVIHSNYVYGVYDKHEHEHELTVKEKQLTTKYTYSETIYQYLKFGKKLFEQFTEVVENFDYVQLDYLKQVPIFNILKLTDRDELYKIGQDSGLKFVHDLYIYIMERHPSLINLFETKLGSFYELHGTQVNPLSSISYSLDPWMYLYNHNFIKYIPLEKEFNIKQGSFKKLIGDKKIPQFKNRLRYYLTNK